MGAQPLDGESASMATACTSCVSPASQGIGSNVVPLATLTCSGESELNL